MNNLWYIHIMPCHSPVKRNKLWIHATAWMNLTCIHWGKEAKFKGSMLFESIYMTFWKRPTSNDTKLITSYQGLKVGGGVRGKLWSEQNNSCVPWFWWWLHDCMYLSKLMELYTKRVILVYVNYTSVFKSQIRHQNHNYQIL